MPTTPRVRTSDGRAVQLNLPGIVRSDKIVKPPRRTEKALQAQTRGALAALGYGSMEAGNGRGTTTCPCCSHTWTPSGALSGNTIGFPDVSFFRFHPAFPPIGIFVEMKSDGTPIRPEQQALADQGRSQICHSIDEAVRAVYSAEEMLDAYRFLPERRELFERYFRINRHNPG